MLVPSWLSYDAPDVKVMGTENCQCWSRSLSAAAAFGSAAARIRIVATASINVVVRRGCIKRIVFSLRLGKARRQMLRRRGSVEVPKCCSGAKTLSGGGAIDLDPLHIPPGQVLGRGSARNEDQHAGVR